MIKQLLVAAFALLLTVPAFAQNGKVEGDGGSTGYQDTVANYMILHISNTPSVITPTIQIKDIDYGYRYQVENGLAFVEIIPGSTVLNLYIEAMYYSEFNFVNWTDGAGNVISQDMGMQVSLAAVSGDYYYTANYRYNPWNPGFLPQGTYDQATATVFINSPEPGAAMDSYMALSDRYNLPNHEKEHHHGDWSQHTYNPLRTIILQGELDTWEASNLCWYATIHTLDLTNASLVEGGVLPGYFINWQDSLHVIKLPRNTTALQEDALNSLFALTDIYLEADSVPVAHPNAFRDLGATDSLGNHSIVTLHVPMPMVALYQADSVWSQFQIDGIPVVTTANISVYPGVDMAGLYIIVGRPGENTFLRQDIEASKLRYEFPNMQLGDTYYVHLYTGNGFLADSITFVLTENVDVHMSNETGLTSLAAHVSAGTTDITAGCLISWMDSTGTNLLQTGAEAPFMPQGYKTLVNIMPLGEMAAYFEPKDTFAIAEAGHNGLWVTLNQKAIGGQDTVRTPTGAVAVVVMTNGENGVGLLYDSIGNLIAKSPFYAAAGVYALAADGLPVGCYSLVTMREGQYSTLSRLDQYNQMGLVQGTDYLLTEACITPDSVTRITIQAIPEEPQIANFLSTDARFYANKSEVMVSGQVILSAEVGFLEEYVENISNVFYVIDLPENVMLVENSVVVGNSVASYSLQDNQLRVGVGLANLSNIKATSLRFCVAPLAPGDYYPSASVEFNYRNNAKVQPISNTFFHSEAITIQVPGYTMAKNFTATGFAPAFANVLIKDAAGNTLGTGAANGLGRYTIHCPFEANENRTFVLHAEASTEIVTGLVSDTASLFYDNEAAMPTEIMMTHYNRWYRKDMTITWDLNNCSTNKTYYYYYLNADFTFSVQFVGATDSVVFVAVGQDGSRTQIPATHQGNNYWTATQYIQTYKVPSRVDLLYRVHGEMAPYETCKSVNPIADPSGYVYEAVSSNRIQGVTATAYMKKSESDMPELWDAEPYDQHNPLITDEAGGYAWDVPSALWQVRFTKTGYEPVQTAWLPVPPPQMEINVPMVRLSAPTVSSITAYADKVAIIFDRYMTIADLDTSMIHVLDNGVAVAGSLQLVDREARTIGDSVFYASKVNFIPANDLISNSVSVKFGACRSYAGVPMAPTTQAANVVAEVKSFGQTDTIHLTVGETVQRAVYALPAMASAGKLMQFAASGTIYSVSASSAIIAADGSATISLTGLMPGSAEMRVGIEGLTLETYIPVVVAPAASQGGTSVETVLSEDEIRSAEKLLDNGVLYILLDGHRYTTTGVMVK